MSPAAYPPSLPLLLAPLVAVFGIARHFTDAGQAYVFALVELLGLNFGCLANYPVLAALAALIAFPVHMKPTRYALPVLPLLPLVALEFAAPRLGRAGPAIALGTLFLEGNLRILALFAASPAYIIEEKWRPTAEAAILSAVVATFPVAFKNPAYRVRAIPASAHGR